MTTTGDNGHYKLRLIGTMTAVVVGAVAVGFVPRCDDVQTRAMAAEQHERLRSECVDNGDRLMRAIEDLTELVVQAIKDGSPDDWRRRRD